MILTGDQMSALGKEPVILLFIQLSPKPLDTASMQRLYPFFPLVMQVLGLLGFKGLFFLMLNQKATFFKFWEKSTKC